MADIIIKEFDWKNPTVQMLGRWQPWHDGHSELFKRCHAMTGQVAIMIRTVPEAREANSRVPGQDDNPFDIKTVKENIRLGLKKEGFTEDEDYVIMIVPNIVDYWIWDVVLGIHLQNTILEKKYILFQLLRSVNR